MSAGPASLHGRAGFPAAARSTWVTSQEPSRALTVAKGTDQVQVRRLISTCCSRRLSSGPGVSEVSRNPSFLRYACMIAIRRCQSGGWFVLDAGPLAVPQRDAILARLLSATACMKPCTAPAAEVAGSAGGALPPPHAARSSPVPIHSCLVTSLSLSEG